MPITDHLFTIGFFRSISLLKAKSSLQDVLRLLTLWFKFGAHDDVSHAMSDGFGTVSIDTWLEVVPQVCEDQFFRAPQSPQHLHR